MIITHPYCFAQLFFLNLVTKHIFCAILNEENTNRTVRRNFYQHETYKKLSDSHSYDRDRSYLTYRLWSEESYCIPVVCEKSSRCQLQRWLHQLYKRKQRKWNRRTRYVSGMSVKSGKSADLALQPEYKLVCRGYPDFRLLQLRSIVMQNMKSLKVIKKMAIIMWM